MFVNGHQYYKGYAVSRRSEVDWKSFFKKVAIVLWPVVVTVVNGLLGLV